MLQKRFQLFLWISIFPLLLIVSFFLSWKALSAQDFFYEFWYDNTKLEKFIDFYAPLNRSKPEFSKTNREERIRLFSETLTSINNQGVGLSNIGFYSSDAEFLGMLYLEAEVEHLSLVASLVSFFNKLALGSFILFIIFVATLYRYKSYVKDIKYILFSYACILSAVALLVVIVKPVNVFSFLHEGLFPEGHQWFFYYQESLMTTLMMAPELFGYFAGVWISSSLLLCALLSISLVKTFSKKFKAISD